MPPKLLHSPKTRRQRASFSRQLRSRASAGGKGSSAPSAATKKKSAAVKKSGPVCKTCTTPAHTVHHHWKQCPKQNERASAPSKTPKSRKSARTKETDARQESLLAELAERTSELLEREDDAMSVDSARTSSEQQDPPRALSVSLGARSDSSAVDTASEGGEEQDDDDDDDVSMAASDAAGSTDSSAADDASPPRAVGALPDFFSDTDEVPDSEPERAAARARAAAGHGTASSDDESTHKSDESSGASSDEAGRASDDDSADVDAQSSDGEDAQSSDQDVADDDMQASSASDEGDASDAEDGESADVQDGEGEGEDREESAEDADDEDEEQGEDAATAGAIDQTASAYFNQAAHVGLIESDDDMDSESRVQKLRKTVEDEADIRRVEIQRQLDHPSPEKVKEQQALLAEVQGAAPEPKDDAKNAEGGGPAPKDDAADAKRREALRAMLAKTVEQRQVDEAATGGSAVISNGWKGNSAAGESITYKRNTAERWSRVNKTHKTVKHDFKPMMQSIVQKGEYLADCLGASVMIIAMPKGGLGNAHTWHSDQIEVDAPGLPQAMRDLWFQQLAGARQQHVSEMAASLETLRAEQKEMHDQLVELNRENQKLKKRLIKASQEDRAERKSRY